MGIEIERKFLVDRELFEPFKANCRSVHMEQGYIQSGSNGMVTMRIRIADDQAFLTLKGKIQGFSRSEYEYNIPVSDAQEMLKSFCYGVVSKRRYFVNFESHIWEVDEFYGDNSELISAEIELVSEDESFIKPNFILDELTGIRRYYNGSLAFAPYNNWPPEQKILSK